MDHTLSTSSFSEIDNEVDRSSVGKQQAPPPPCQMPGWTDNISTTNNNLDNVESNLKAAKLFH